MVRVFTVSTLLFLAAAMIACGDGDDAPPAGDWPSFFTLADLVASSDIIIVAQLGDEQTRTIEAPPATDGSQASIIEIVRTFVVEESLKGDLIPGDLLNTFSTASVATTYTSGRDPSESVYQVLKVDQDQSYLLFLSLVEVPDFYPDDLGAHGWAAPGEPHTARVMDDGALVWETTGRYDDARDARGIPPGEQGAGPAFDITIDVVAALAASEPSPAATVPAASPSP